MKQDHHSDRDAGQMLLATGVVLLMSLLSMAIFGVKVAGLTIPHDAASDDVLVTTAEVVDALPEITQARTNLWIEGGLEGTEAANLALATVHDDILHHGEIRGVEVKLTDLNVISLDENTLQVTAELGVSDGEAMLTIDVDFTLDI